MKCRRCRRELAEGEPAYRVSVGYNYPWLDRSWPRAVGSVCAECAAKHFNWGRAFWREAKPCCMCQRPVISSSRRRETKFIVCSEQCQQAAYGAEARRKRQLGKRTTACSTCGEQFLPKRADAAYCSSACRQHAYRSRMKDEVRYE